MLQCLQIFLARGRGEIPLSPTQQTSCRWERTCAALKSCSWVHWISSVYHQMSELPHSLCIFLLPWRHCLGQWSRQGNEQSRELSSDEISRTTFGRRQLWTLATRVDLIHLERPGSKARGAFLAFLQWSWKRYIMIWFNTYDFAVITLLICP